MHREILRRHLLIDIKNSQTLHTSKTTFEAKQAMKLILLRKVRLSQGVPGTISCVAPWYVPVLNFARFRHRRNFLRGTQNCYRSVEGAYGSERNIREHGTGRPQL